MTSASRSVTPPAIRAQLAAVLADTTREVEQLREELAQAKKRAEYFESIVNADERIRDAEKRAEKAERERDIEIQRNVGALELWRQVRGYLDTVENQAKEAKAGFDRFISSTGHGEKRNWIEGNQYPNKRARPTVNTHHLAPNYEYQPLSSARHSPGAESAGSMSVDDMLLEASSVSQESQQQQQPGQGNFQVRPQTPQSATVPQYYPPKYRGTSAHSTVSPSSSTTTASTMAYPQKNSAGHRICRQCGVEGRYKDGRCVEKWGPGPCGPGTVCDRCRKKIKRLERRGTMEAQQTQLYPQHPPQRVARMHALGQSKSLPSPLSQSTSPRIIATNDTLPRVITVADEETPHSHPPTTSAEDDLEALISEQGNGQHQQGFNESSVRTQTDMVEDDPDADGSAEEDLLEAVEASEGAVAAGA